MAHFLKKIFLFLLVHNSEFLENIIKNDSIRTHFDVAYIVLNGLIMALELSAFTFVQALTH